jgi:ribosome-associated toxin RatA of RatAB toxin-antitoxin module
MYRHPVLALLAVTFAIAPVAQPARAELDDEAGVFTAQLPEAGSSIAWGQAVLVVDRPIEEVLPVIRDYANYVTFMPNFTKSRVLAQRGGRAMVYMEVSVAKGAITLWGQLALAEQPRDGDFYVVEARLMEGNVDAFNASFTLRPVHGGARTEVEFRIFVDPDIPLPASVFSRENERAAGRTVRALRARVFEGPRGRT